MTDEPDLFDKLQEMTDRIERLRERELKKLDKIEVELLLVEALSVIRRGKYHPSAVREVAALKEKIRKRIWVAACQSGRSSWASQIAPTSSTCQAVRR